MPVLHVQSADVCLWLYCVLPANDVVPRGLQEALLFLLSCCLCLKWSPARGPWPAFEAIFNQAKTTRQFSHDNWTEKRTIYGMSGTLLHFWCPLLIRASFFLLPQFSLLELRKKKKKENSPWGCRLTYLKYSTILTGFYYSIRKKWEIASDQINPVAKLKDPVNFAEFLCRKKC